MISFRLDVVRRRMDPTPPSLLHFFLGNLSSAADSCDVSVSDSRLRLPSPILPCRYSASVQLFLVSARFLSVPYCSLMRVAIPQIYVGAEGWLSHFLHG